jgi:Putative flagellar
MLGGLALVVNVPSSTVLTAVEPNGQKESVFTNIDSVVIA